MCIKEKNLQCTVRFCFLEVLKGGGEINKAKNEGINKEMGIIYIEEN